MNTTKRISQFVLAIAFIATGTSCKKEKKPEPVSPNSPTGTLSLHMHTYIGTNEVEDYDSIYTDASGRKISLHLSQMYISGIELVKADGSFYNISNAKILKVLEDELYLLGNVPVGNYKTIRFKVGLDAATNGADPSVNSSLLDHPEMWFNTTAQPGGYVFLHAQGKIDTTASASGPEAGMQPFTWKIGTNAHYQQVVMPDQPFTIFEGQDGFIHLGVDYSKLFTGIDLHQPLSVSSAADNATVLGNAVANNVSAMFSYE